MINGEAGAVDTTCAFVFNLRVWHFPEFPTSNEFKGMPIPGSDSLDRESGVIAWLSAQEKILPALSPRAVPAAADPGHELGSVFIISR